jgi:hypothetical protein
LSLNFGPDILVEYLPVIILFYKHFTWHKETETFDFKSLLIVM